MKKESPHPSFFRNTLHKLHEVVIKKSEEKSTTSHFLDKFLWEYADKHTKNQGKSYYLKSLCELLLLQQMLPHTHLQLPPSPVLTNFFSAAAEEITQTPQANLLLKQAADQYGYCPKSAADQPNTYLNNCFALTFGLWYKPPYFRTPTLPKICITSLNTLLFPPEQKTAQHTITLTDPFSNRTILLQKVLQENKNRHLEAGIYFKSFIYYLKNLTQAHKSINSFWLNPLQSHHSNTSGQQTNIFSTTQKLQAQIRSETHKNIPLILSDLRQLPKEITQHTSPEILKNLKKTYLKEETQKSISTTDGLLRICRWATDRLAKSGNIAFLVEEDAIKTQKYSTLRQYLERDFKEIYLVEIEKNNISFFILHLKEKK